MQPIWTMFAIVFLDHYVDLVEKMKIRQKKFLIVPCFEDFKDFRAFFQKNDLKPKILVLEKNFCSKKSCFLVYL